MKLREDIVRSIESWGGEQWSKGHRAAIEASKTPDKYGFVDLREDVLSLLTEASLPCQSWYHGGGHCHDRCGRAMKILRNIDRDKAERMDQMRKKVSDV